MSKYKAKVIEKIDNGPGVMNSIKVGVFRVEGEREEQVCEYIRNYSTLFNTFYHCKKANKDLALYSPHYTATRVMELPSGKDIGGEEPSSWGFCPVDYYVPSYIEQEFEWTSQDGAKHITRQRLNEPSEDDLLPSEGEYSRATPISPLLYYPFGFIAGCIWGDDSSYKIQYLDLSEVEKGIIRREERFGYIAIPEGLTLRQAIDLCDYMDDPNEDRIIIAIQKQFNLRTGKVID
ncbi:MAG: hypothetical protein IPP66_01660 [Anaerolineales bacterium]|nr:hypothetical protein [Anaerolineales bacterium]